MKYNQIKTKLNEEHSLGLLKKVAAQMDKDARNGDYNSIDELLEDIPTERLEGYLSDNLYPYVEESEVSEDKDYNLIAQRKTMNLSDQAIIALIASLYKQLDAKESIDEVDVDNEGNIAGYLDTIDEYVEMLFNSAKGTAKDVSLSKESATTIAYRIQNAVDDIRTRELGLKPSNIRAQYNEDTPRKAVHASKTEKLNEIDPSRSPWTQSGKHPGAMSQAELRREIAVFDELRDRGDHLSPRELAQEDSLYNYFYEKDGQDIVAEITKEATYVAEKSKWLASRKK